MLDLFSRQAYHMTLVLKPIPSEAPDVFLNEFLPAILNQIDAGEAVHLTQNDTRAMRARKYRYDDEENILYLLLNYSDANLGDPAFETLETGELRVEPKLDGEGIAVSTYMAIDLELSSDRFPHYKTVLEDVPGIGRTKICPFLTYLVRVSDVRQKWKEPDGKQRISRPEFGLEGEKSQALENDLKNGRLSFIELVRYYVNEDFDEEGILEEEKSILRLKVKRDDEDNRIGLLNRIKRRANEQGYTEMRLRYSNSSRRSKTVDFGTAREDVADVLTVNSSEVKLRISRQQRETEIRDDVVDRLKEIVLLRRLETQ